MTFPIFDCKFFTPTRGKLTKICRSLDLCGRGGLEEYILEADFIPRVDMIFDEKYYDNYYFGIDKYMFSLYENQTSNGLVLFPNDPYKVLHRLVASPASLRVKMTANTQVTSSSI